MKCQHNLALKPSKLDEAHAVLTEAQTIAANIGWRRELWQLLLLLATVEERRGNTSIATVLHHETRTALNYILEHIPQGGLRIAFMALPEVKKTLDDS